MSEHFIKEIEIKKYKLFKDFKAEGFGRVNLIGGKNNVGKTAFMEACYLNVSTYNIKTYTDALGNITLNRDKINFYLDNFRDRNNEPLKESTRRYIENVANFTIVSNIGISSYHIKEHENGSVEYHFNLNGNILKVNVNEFSYRRERIKNIKFIDIFGLSKKNISDMYINLTQEEQNKLLLQIKNFDQNIINFEINEEIPFYTLSTNKKLNLIESGDGLRKLISLYISIYNCSGGYLFIDEIENGIHYTNLDRLWEIILTLSKKQNVQVFATTHSKECIESFNRVQKKLEDKDTYYFEMAKNIKTNKIFMTRIDSEQLEYGLAHNERIRGE